MFRGVDRWWETLAESGNAFMEGNDTLEVGNAVQRWTNNPRISDRQLYLQTMMQLQYMTRIKSSNNR